MIPKTHRRVVLVAARRRSRRKPISASRRCRCRSPARGQLLVRVIYLSLDPYMRGRMRDAASYAAPVGIGEVMTGRHRRRGREVEPPRLQGRRHRRGSAGLAGVRHRPRPGAAQDRPVAGADLHRQRRARHARHDRLLRPLRGRPAQGRRDRGGLGRLRRRRPGGRASSPRSPAAAPSASPAGAKKCAFVKDTLGFDACIDYKAEKDLDRRRQGRLPQRRRRLLRQRRRRGERRGARQPQLLCARGAVRLDLAIQHAPSRARACMGTFVGKRVTARGFIVWDFNSKYGPALRQMGEWVRSGRSSTGRTSSRASTRRRAPSSASCAARTSASCRSSSGRTPGRGETADSLLSSRSLVTGIHAMPHAPEHAGSRGSRRQVTRDDSRERSQGSADCPKLSSPRAGARSGRCS